MPVEDNGNVLRERVDRLRADLTKAETDIEKLEETVIAMGKTIAALQERMTVANIAQGIFTAIASTVATVLGRIP